VPVAHLLQKLDADASSWNTHTRAFRPRNKAHKPVKPSGNKTLLRLP